PSSLWQKSSDRVLLSRECNIAAGRLDLQRCGAVADHAAQRSAALLAVAQHELAAYVAAGRAGRQAEVAVVRQPQLHIARDCADAVRAAARQAALVVDAAAGRRNAQPPLARAPHGDVARYV